MKISSEESAPSFYQPFIRSLEESASQQQPLADRSAQIRRLLDGAASEAVQQLLPKDVRSRDGIFFSGHKLAERAVGLLADRLAKGCSVHEPACGAGDLLIAAARKLPLRESLDHTLHQWGVWLSGCDLHADFAVSTKLRLLLLAMFRHAERGDQIAPRALTSLDFPNIVQGNYFERSGPENSSCLISNPPFGHVTASGTCQWSSGRVQLAAVFVERMIERAVAGQQMSIILPDVLRSGSRYRRWRNWVSSRSSSLAIEPFGRFSENTDVDVFILFMTKSEIQGDAVEDWTPRNNTGYLKLGDLVEIRNGPLVPHRHKGGPWVPYLAVANAPAYGETEVTARRRFSGTLFSPPFIVIRRTSNPADRNRIVTTIVTGKDKVAVENHLIVLKPLRGGLTACRKICSFLKGPEATGWINEHIRCRHITIEALNGMPLTFEA